jgi:hypothetical protein
VGLRPSDSPRQEDPVSVIPASRKARDSGGAEVLRPLRDPGKTLAPHILAM